MRIHATILLVILLMLLSECSNTRFLAEDQVLYTGRQKVEIITEQKGASSAPVKTYVNALTGHKVNNALLGRRILPPIGLWTHNYWKVDEQKKVGSWLHRKLSAAPVLISDINPELRAQKIEKDLFDQGYFQTRAWSVVDTSARDPKKARISYFVAPGPSTHYGKVEIDTFRVNIDTTINKDEFRKQIKTGKQFNLDKLKSARNGLSREIQNRGYFYFIPDYIELIADTTVGDSKLNLWITKQKDLPLSVLSRYKIDDILVRISRATDSVTAITDSAWFDGITIISTNHYLKPHILRNSILFTGGELYSYDSYQKTIARLNNLGIFSYVRITFNQSKADSLQRLLDVRIDLIVSDNINVDFEADLVTKSTGFLGPALSVGVSHGNTFKGAEKVHLKLNGGFEWQWGPKQENQLGTFAYDFGVGSGLTLPRIILPGQKSKIKTIMNQQTSMNFDLNILNRTAYYQMFSAMTNIEYKWGKRRDVMHSFSPIYLNSVSLLATTPEFDSIVNENIYIRKSFEEQFIFGMKYEFTYDNTFKIQPHNIFFQTGVSTSGNYIDLFASIGKDASDRPFTIMNTVYSQHIKLTTDFRYYINRFNKSLVFRLYAGVGMPYLNSTVLPYVEQFFSGGAYSVRGFTARTLGPGSFYEEERSYIDQSGDLKLEGNLEYRFGISKLVKGAVFIETGNIWLVNEDENRPGAKFEFNNFYNQLAVGTGIGLRFDFNIFVLRTDLGFPLRTAYELDDRNWLIGTNNFFSEALFYLAIGHPF